MKLYTPAVQKSHLNPDLPFHLSAFLNAVHQIRMRESGKAPDYINKWAFFEKSPKAAHNRLFGLVWKLAKMKLCFALFILRLVS